MNLLDENNFAENRNGHIGDSQLAELKKQANIWLDLFLLISVFAIVGFIKMLANDVSWIIILFIALGSFLLWFGLRLPVLYKYYFLILPDVRNENIAHTTAKLDYRNGYILQAEDIRFSLGDDKNSGLMAGNVYEVYYLPRAKVALSARVQQSAGESQQAHEFTLLIQKVIRFSDEELAANRNGEFPSTQRWKILQKNWLWVLVIVVISAFTLWQIIPMWVPPMYIDDAIIFTIMSLGLMLFILVVLYFATFGVRGVFTALLGQKIKQAEGVARVSSRISGYGKSQKTHYFLEIFQAVSLEIPERVYDVLVDGLYYRVFYLAGTKYLLSAEVLRPQEQTGQPVAEVPYELSAKDKENKGMAADKAKSALDQRVDREFPPETREKARSSLNRLTLISKDIVQKRILELAKGDAALVESLVKKVENEDDYREALMFLQ
jgi:hypothetical protein